MTSFSFFDLFPHVGPIEIVDVGAAPVEGASAVYSPLLERQRARLTGFEPDGVALAKLRQAMGAPHQFFPYFVGDGTPATFHTTSSPLTGSIYPPNTEVLSRYLDVEPFVQLVGTAPVRTHRLDDVAEITRADFLKLDVQGAALDVLKGAERLLRETLVIHVEVEFVQLYANQPLFGDVDRLLRGAGFQFHTFKGLARRFVKPLRIANLDVRGINQMLWADAVYIRDLSHVSSLPADRQIMLAALMHELYGSVDVASHILMYTLGQHNAGLPVMDYFQRAMAATQA